ncbi:MAG: hypothetical protein Q8Q46_02845 [Candidatus Giovannonibacteria bacterium]|nr:hypothetical protein [Candidatus Giovannonibacteria bacterium]
MKIVRRASELGRSLHLPVFGERVFPKLFSNLIELAPKEKGYSSTLKLVKALSAVAKKRGWKNILVVAQPNHTVRCIRDLKQFSFNAEADNYFRERGMYLYDKKSLQWYTRSAWQFWLREAPLRFLPWWLYDLIAG